MSEALDKYPLGYSEAEAERLAVQADLFRNLTEDFLRRAGVTSGMHVLDVGCGVGDVSLLLRRLVGANGFVLGIDRSAASVETGQRRAAAQKWQNVRFEAAEIESFEPSERFDAVVGRFVLLYMPDPPKALRRFWQWLRDGGVLAFQEMDMSQAAQTPPSPLFEQTVGLIRATFAAGSVECDMGSKLLSAYRVAGLPWPEMCAAALAGGGPDWPGAELMARTLSSLLPMAERAGLTRPGEIDIGTLAARINADAAVHERLNFAPRLVGAWARAPQG